LSRDAAAAVADLIHTLRRHHGGHDLIRGREGVFHVVADAAVSVPAE
jgi:hypothetical protein